MSAARPVYGCHDKPRPTSETSYVAQTSVEIIRDGFGAPFRQPSYVDIKHTMSTNCRYDKSQTDDRCRGCKNAGDAMKESESNMPPLPDPVGMYAPYGMNCDQYPVWHRGQMLDAIRAAVLKERQEIEKIVRMHGISPNPIDDPHPDAELINGALSCVVDAIRNRT